LGGETEDRAGAEESGEKREEKVKAKFCRAAEDTVREDGLPGAFREDAQRDSLKIPQRA
jgi:hypothetical protein